MKLENYTKFNIEFKSGLTRKILLNEIFQDTKKQEELFAKKYSIEVQFKDNKAISYANSFCLDVLKQLFKKLNLYLLLPPVVRVYDSQELNDKNSAKNFCIPDTCEVLNDDYPFPGRSIFFKNIKGLQVFDDITESLYKDKEISSSHFIYFFLHEWLHSLHLDYIYNNFGYGGSCTYMQQQYPKKNTSIDGYNIIKALESKALSKEENEIIYDVLGKYATLPYNQYLEIFSETWTKFICNALSGVRLVKNPVDLFKQTPKEFQMIYKKIFQLK